MEKSKNVKRSTDKPFKKPGQERSCDMLTNRNHPVHELPAKASTEDRAEERPQQSRAMRENELPTHGKTVEAETATKCQQGTRDVAASRAYFFHGGDNRDFTYGEIVVPRAAWLVSLKAIALDDSKWLKAFPIAPCRVREITPIEVAVTGLPAGTIVTVAAFPDGRQRRRFFLPHGDAAELNDGR